MKKKKTNSSKYMKRKLREKLRKQNKNKTKKNRI